MAVTVKRQRLRQGRQRPRPRGFEKDQKSLKKELRSPRAPANRERDWLAPSGKNHMVL
jgi:hypothetical protein